MGIHYFHGKRLRACTGSPLISVRPEGASGKTKGIPLVHAAQDHTARKK